MLTADTITKHHTRQSCWVVVEGHVYDLTEYLDDHPGGAEIILRYAGKACFPETRTELYLN
jgi:L-lactate dehydrogenase (cytochrome)